MLKRTRKILSHIIPWMLALCLAVGTFPGIASAQARSGGTLSGMVRVYLSSIGSLQSVDLTIAGSYSIGGDANRALARGEKITVANQGGTLRMTRSGVSETMGASFKLRRHTTSGENGVRIAQARNSANLYPGDIEFRARGGNVQIIVHVYIEDYMRGVLPYEMSNSFPLEALKAQAVAARTYTLKKMSAGASDYDVVDTTSDQTYRGTPSGNANCVAAVNETKGIVGLYCGSYMVSYYTASNGGQTESVKNAWNSTSYSYLTVKDDPYDLRNTASSSRSATIYKSGSMDSGLSELLRASAGMSLAAMGYLSGSENVTIRSVESVQAIDPKYAAPSRLYTKVAFSLLVTATRPDGTREHVAYPISVTLDYFSQMESLLSLSLNSTKNELITIEETDNAFKIIARRYGHGIGMSQRGAQQMAKEGFTYEEILDFYYPGTERVAYTFTRTLLSAIDGGGSVTEDEEIVDGGEAGDAIVTLRNPLDTLNLRKETSTVSSIIARIPHGTPLRVLEKLEGWSLVQYGALSGYVSNDYLIFTELVPEETQPPQNEPAPLPTQMPIVHDACIVTLNSGKLNLRSHPSTSSAVLALLPNGTRLEHLGMVDDSWALVRYSGIEGYASARYLRMDATATPAPTAAPEATQMPEVQEPPMEESATDKAVVVLSSETQTLNLRLLPTTASSIISRIRHGSQVQILERYNAWSYVRYGSLTGYVMNDYLYFPGNFEAPGESTPVPEVTPIPEGTATPMPEATLVPLPTATPDTQPEAEGLIATVALSNPYSSLNVRQTPGAGAQRIGEIPHGLQVRVLEYGDAWCGIDYAGTTGYVATQYLQWIDGPSDSDDDEGLPEITSVPAPTPKPQRVSAVEVDVRKYLNVREAPETNARIIGRVRTGSIQTVTDTIGGFYEIIFGGDGYGYISADYAKPVEWSDLPAHKDETTSAPLSTPTPSAPQTDTPEEEAATAPDEAPQPETNDENADGTPTQEQDEKPEEIPHTPDASVPEVTPAPEMTPEPYETASPSRVINEGKTAYVAEIYEVCGDENTALMGVEKGESVRVVAYAAQDGWAQVEMQGVYGYMRMKDLSLRYEAVRLASGASYSLYESASYDAAVLDTISGGEWVSVLDADGEWAKVRVQGAKNGYILFDALDLTSD